MQAFVDKGRLSDLLARMPVNVVTTRAALFGAAFMVWARCRLPERDLRAWGAARHRVERVISHRIPMIFGQSPRKAKGPLTGVVKADKSA